MPGYQVQPSGLPSLALTHPAPSLSHWGKSCLRKKKISWKSLTSSPGIDQWLKSMVFSQMDVPRLWQTQATLWAPALEGKGLSPLALLQEGISQEPRCLWGREQASFSALHLPCSPVSLGIALLEETVETTELCWQNSALTSAGIPIPFSSFLFGL